ncbi:MAG: proteasome assembly chaperone family protein [Nanoarchaeota archaeon]|nr:proteasome assembly chaperone family protein [Nanoarchaeota archaeon]
MELKLKESPKNPIIIEGFPGVGLIGTITTEYLIKHLKAKPIGFIKSEEIAPIAAVHEGKVVQPLELYYVKSKNLIIVHSLVDVRGIEWEIADALTEVYKKLKAKEIISIEGIMSQNVTSINTYFYSNNSTKTKKLADSSAKPLKEGILMGVTAALLLHSKDINTTGVFVETHTKLPDSMASARIIEILDVYLGLGVDYKPLEKAAAEFENKLKDYVGKVEKNADKTDVHNKKVNYFG